MSTYCYGVPRARLTLITGERRRPDGTVEYGFGICACDSDTEIFVPNTAHTELLRALLMFTTNGAATEREVREYLRELRPEPRRSER